MIVETKELTINRMIIVDQVAAFLYATGHVNDSEEISNIQFGDLFGVSDTEHSKLKIWIRKEDKPN